MRLSEVIAALKVLEAKIGGEVWVENPDGLTVTVREGKDENGDPCVVIE